VTTFYRREPDGSLSIKLEGKLKGVPLFDQVAVLREIDFYSRWSPFCSSSLSIAHLDKLDTVGWIVVGLPHFGLMRDGCFRAIGCDSIYEDGSVLLVAHGVNDRPEDGAANLHLDTVASSPTTAATDATASTRHSTGGRLGSNGSNSSSKQSEAQAFELYCEEEKIFDVLSQDPILQTLDIPAPPTRMGSGRMTIKTFQASIQIESPTLATTKLVANIDPNIPLLPQILIDFVMKRMCGVLLNKLQGAAKKVSKDPITNPHAMKMREEEDFYKGWLMEKFRGVCKLRGWQMTPVAAFELTEAQLEMANSYAATTKQQKLEKGSLRLYHSMSNDKLDNFLESPRSVTGTEPAFVGRGDDSSGPNVRAISSRGYDDMSELSNKSFSSTSSIWRRNPIATYLREVEERTQMEKLQKIEQSRARAADRLKRKALDDISHSRLQELRAARARRYEGGEVDDPADAVAHARSISTAPLIKSANHGGSSVVGDTQQDWAVFWTRHGWFTRLVVVAFLICVLFYLLYMNTAFERYVKYRDGPFWMGRKRDVAALGYMGVTGLVHFFLCYVAHMYAFSSLKVGMIAGKQAKKFYSQNVHLLVGCSSASMIVLSIVKACSANALKLIVWRSHVLAVAAAEGPLSSLPSLPNAVASLIPALYNAAIFFLTGVRTFLLEATILGRSLVAVYDLLAYCTLSCYMLWSDFAANAVDEYIGTTESMTWRADAFGTTRVLLAYSATFSLVLLFAFNMMARYSRSVEFVATTSTVDDSTLGGAQESSELSNRSIPAHTRSLPTTFEPIGEHDELIEFVSHNSDTQGGKGSSMKNTPRRGVRFRQGIKSSGA
jgi:hypothetical protein